MSLINKGMEFIDLHSIFKDNLVISSIPNYFNNSETPISVRTCVLPWDFFEESKPLL